MNKAAVKAIRLIGGRKKAAELFDITYEAVRRWELGGVPLRRCPAVLRAIGGQMSMNDFYPEFYERMETPDQRAKRDELAAA